MGQDGLPQRHRIRRRPRLPIAHFPLSPDETKAVQLRTAEYLDAPRRYRNSLGMPMVLVPAGQYRMGKPKGHRRPKPVHGPRRANWLTDCPRQRSVRVEWPFYVAAWPVTQGQYQAVMVANPSKSKRFDRWARKNCPVESVLWEEAAEFCRRLSQCDGRTYRLPTMSEWEYFCRAGSAQPFCFGSGARSLAAYAWFADNSGLRTRPVGRCRPNGWGLFDTHGNVFEWCEDPMDLVLISGEADLPSDNLADFHLARGGAYNCSPALCCAYLRGWFHGETRYDIVGFRPVCEV